MGTGRGLLFVAASIAMATAPAKAAAYCWGTDPTIPGSSPNFYSPRQEFARAEYVVEVEALAETWLDDEGHPAKPKRPFQNGGSRPWGFDPYMGAYYDLRVLRTFKGSPPPRLRIFSENSTARVWLDRGRRYILFLSWSDHDPPVGKALSADNCGNSIDIREARELLAQLKAITK